MKSPQGDGPRVVLVTGGARGIGAAVVRRFLEAQWHVVLTARAQASFDEFRETLPLELRGEAEFLPADFLRADSMDACVSFVERMDRLDALVNNAGENINNPVTELRVEDVRRLYEVNLESAIRLMQVAARLMKAAGTGRIVNVASIWSVISRGGRLAYSASKAGLVGATRAAAIDLAESGVLVNAVSPGFTMTELTVRTLSEADVRELSGRVPLRRFAQPSEIAGAVFFLCSQDNTYITGQNLVVDGGYTVV